MITLKSLLYNACMTFVSQRAENIHKTIESNRKALVSETKSSAGDKHETGRAMLQLEIEKASQQLAEIDQMKTIIAKISLENSKVIRLGSLVITDKANYFLAISAGEIVISDIPYYAVSTGSPIGKLLLGKKVGDSIFFKQKIDIQKIY